MTLARLGYRPKSFNWGAKQQFDGCYFWLSLPFGFSKTQFALSRSIYQQAFFIVS